jgi:3'-5' exoribonuclease
MKSPCVGTLPPNEVVTAQFLVISKEIRQKKTGEPYLSLHLADRTGEIEAKMWDNVAEVMTTFERDDFVKVKALVQIYQNRSQLTVHRLRRLEDHEVDFADYFPCSERDPEEMFSELQSIIAGLGNSHFQALLNAIFADTRLAQSFKMAPAAKNIHHACRGGLLEHVLSLCGLCRLLASHYESQNIDVDLLLTGAILHDIGKIEELSYARSFGYSADGQLLGHIVIGLRMIGAKIDTLDGFPAKLRTLLEHLIISHHGELEFGSPKVPAFPEALLLHHVDNLDSKMNAMRTALNRDRSVDGEFTSWIPSLERVLLKKDRYLQTGPAPPASAAAAPPSPAEMPAPQPAADGLEIASEDAQTAHPEPRPAPKPPPHHSEQRSEHRPSSPTLFGEKLQAVLDPRK